MPDYEHVCDQIEQTALHQLIVLDQTAQILRGRLTGILSADETLELTHALLAVNHTLLAWCHYLVPPREGDTAVCHGCRPAENAEEG